MSADATPTITAPVQSACFHKPTAKIGQTSQLSTPHKQTETFTTQTPTTKSELIPQMGAIPALPPIRVCPFLFYSRILSTTDVVVRLVAATMTRTGVVSVDIGGGGY